MTPFVPNAGDVVWIDFDPRTGHEQAGRRPALVLSPAAYNQQRGMMICCPMTSRTKNYAFEVAVTIDPPSVVLADQIRSVDWRARKAARNGAVAPLVLADVNAKLKALLGI